MEVRYKLLGFSCVYRIRKKGDQEKVIDDTLDKKLVCVSVCMCVKYHGTMIMILSPSTNKMPFNTNEGAALVLKFCK